MPFLPTATQQEKAVRQQCVFYESPEKGLRIHQTVFWCEEEHRGEAHLTF